MNADSACKIINDADTRFMPDWKVSARLHDQFQATVIVRVEYPTHNSNRDQAAQGYPAAIRQDAEFPIITEECDDVAALAKRLITEAFAQVFLHEAREFLRFGPTCWAPLHPHRIDGMKRWGDVTGDLKFGLV